ncbi:hypothetical protein BFN03_17405 [Rhodococcus sp. WMMA185]|nr:hypothetical protein BFN03_17405 [Rhodococcus sp. WMMA185]
MLVPFGQGTGVGSATSQQGFGIDRSSKPSMEQDHVWRPLLLSVRWIHQYVVGVGEQVGGNWFPTRELRHRYSRMVRDLGVARFAGGADRLEVPR